MALFHVIPAPYPDAGLRGGSLRQKRGKLQPESRIPGGNREPVFKMVPDFRRDWDWTPVFTGVTAEIQFLHSFDRLRVASAFIADVFFSKINVLIFCSNSINIVQHTSRKGDGTMEEKKFQPKKLTVSNTKQEMLEAYNTVLKQLEAQKEAELKPEKRLEEKKAREVIQVAESLSSEGVAKEISNLKIETSKTLAQISDRLEEEVNKFRAIQSAITLKEKELQELYDIEKSAVTLAALIESQNQKRQAFESEMAEKKESLNQEIETLRAEREKEKKDYDEEIKERDIGEKKRRDREKEDYEYAFKREQKLAKDKFEDEKAKVEKEIQTKRAQMENELKEREKVLTEREEELNDLRKRVSTFPKEMEAVVNKAIKETTERLQLEAKNREELQKKEFIGERNVLTTRIESLEKTVKEQNEQISKLSQQQEKAYQQVQEIAVKTIEGSSTIKSFANLQQWISEQVRKPSQEK